MYCHQCGEVLKEGARFCSECGAAQESRQTPEPPISQPAPETPIPQPAPATPTSQPAPAAEAKEEKKYVRLTRSEYWLATLIACAVSAFFSWAGGFFGIIMSVLISIFQIGLNIGRLHDCGRSGHYLWWMLLPVAGWIMILIQVCRPSDGDNKYGPAPTSQK